MHPVEQVKHLPKSSGVYEIQNGITGRMYVGSSVNIRERGVQHVRDLNKGVHRCKHLQHAWNKYGSGSFVFVVLELCEVNRLVSQENAWMVSRNVFKNGYNTYTSSATGRGYRQSIEHVRNRTMHRVGSTLPDNVRQAVSKSNAEREWTTEQRRSAQVRLSAGKAAMGKEEFSRHLSESMRGRVLTEEHKHKLSLARSGVTWRDKPGGDERAARTGAKALGRKISKEESAKRSVSQKKKWNDPANKKAASERVHKGWGTRRANLAKRSVVDDGAGPPLGQDAPGTGHEAVEVGVQDVGGGSVLLATD